MILSNKYILLLVGLFAAHLIFAESEPPNNQNESSNNSSQRFFFFKRFVNCNYTTQAGSSCLGCRTTLFCAQSNVGVARLCKGFLRPYCNQGACSSVPGAACSG
ncbi:PREDICTED: uncharacterized protein LOC106126642 [Papilio xuthus]|uniref:Uncharacterized protein LOC106126642 n=1 Tax=Papilio xuthus TaxID=66420 RepID=A0AAJ6ZV80_PAPXU|nr:PREDICTED: uncharacterized protein LOC106126642 [Papilio xuthus]